MKTYKAQPTGDVVPDLLIEATDTIPSCSTEDALGGKWTKILQSEAIKIVDALYASLPGGVIHLIFAELAYRRACELRVPLLDRGKPEV